MTPILEQEKLLAELVNAPNRRLVARRLAACYGASDLLFFISDPELNVLLPAPGFPQTLPAGRAWQSFLQDCLIRGQHSTLLPFPDKDTLQPVTGLAIDPNAVGVLIGSGVDLIRFTDLTHLLPLVTAALRGERAILNAAGQAAAAREATAQAQDIARSLEVLRHELQRALQETEAARQESNRLAERYSSLVRAMAQIVWTTNAAGEVVTDLPEWRAVTGQSEAEVKGLGWLNALHSEDRERAARAWDEAIRTKSFYDTEYRVRTTAGTYSYLASRGVPVLRDDGTIREWVGICIDITERKTAEAEREQLINLLQTERARLETILQQMPAGVIMAEAPSGKLVLANDQVNRILHHEFIPAAGIEQYAKYKVFYPNGQPYAPEDYPMARAIMRGEIVTDEELEYLAGHGQRITLSVSAAPVRDADGQIIAGIVTFHDITERKRIAAALKSQQQWLESILNLMPTAMLLIEPGTAKVLFANKAADEMAGGEFPKGKVAAEYHTVYYCTDSQGERIPNDQMPGVRVARGEKLEGFEMDWHTPLGKRSIIVVAETLPAMHGHPATAILVFHDVSHLKQIEADLQQANKLKDEFLANVSHELRTPLNAILGWARLLRSRTMTQPELERALETIERNARLQAQIINDILDVSRIITGKLQLEMKLLELEAVIRAAIDTVRPAAEAKGLTLQTNFADDVGLIAGDAQRLQQVIWNLLSNAIKFTPAGGWVEVKLSRAASQVAVSVSDSGEGISPEFLPYVFDRFRQADSSSTRRHGGLGLGLSIVRHILELHGGTVEVSSGGLGQGATFTIKLPLPQTEPADELARAAITDAAPSPLMEQALGGLNGLRVLIVDDDNEARELLSSVLALHQTEVRTAASAAEAFEALLQWPPDVIVSDIAMPQEDGYSLIRRIRRLAPELGGTTPAIALTAYTRSEDRIRALAAGFQLYIPKPVELDELILAIASLTHRSSNSNN